MLISYSLHEYIYKNNSLNDCYVFFLSFPFSYCFPFLLPDLCLKCHLRTIILFQVYIESYYYEELEMNCPQFISQFSCKLASCSQLQSNSQTLRDLQFLRSLGKVGMYWHFSSMVGCIPALQHTKVDSTLQCCTSNYLISLNKVAQHTPYYLSPWFPQTCWSRNYSSSRQYSNLIYNALQRYITAISVP